MGDDVEAGDMWLPGPGVPDGLPIAALAYGQTPAIAIDPDERWCEMVYFGLVVYQLGAPWLPCDNDWPRNHDSANLRP